MRLIRFIVWMFPVTTMVSGAGSVCGQDFPNKPIRILTGSPGASIDFMARLIAQEIAGPLGQPVFVENKAAIVAAETVAKALPDGHTLLVYGPPFWIRPLLQKLSYDPIRDFSPITLAGITPNILVVHPSLPVKSVNELIAFAKSRPGALNYAASGIGGAGHLAAELFKTMAGVNIVHISFKGNAPAVISLLGGEVEIMFPTVGEISGHVKSGRLRALAVASAQPSTLYPGLPTVSASLPGFVSASMTGVFAPAKTPAMIISRLNQEMVRGLKTAESKEKILNFGSEVIASSPEQVAATVKSEMDTLGKLIKDLGIRGE